MSEQNLTPPHSTSETATSHESKNTQSNDFNAPKKKRNRDKNELQFVHDVPLEVTVELGRINVTIRDLLSLKKGSVLEIEKLAGEPLEILINDRLICRGEVIVVNEKYGIRMTDIIKPGPDEEFELQNNGNVI